MAAYTKYALGGSTFGKQIPILSTSSATATFIHTSTGLQNTLDEVWIYAYNDYTASLSCSILWGGTTEPNDVIRFPLYPRSGRVMIVDGKLLQNALTVKAYAEKSGFISFDGYINQIDNNTSAGNSSSSSYALTASYVSGIVSSREVILCAAFTPYLTGPDFAEVQLPYDSNNNPISWSVNRLNLRVQLSGSTTSSLFLESSTSTGSFVGSFIGTLILNSGSYETSTSSFATLVSGNKMRFNINTIGTAQYWNVSAEISSL